MVASTIFLYREKWYNLTTLPGTNSSHLKNCWLEDDLTASFLGSAWWGYVSCREAPTKLTPSGAVLAILIDGSEIRRSPPGMKKNPVNHGINYLSSAAGFLPSTVSVAPLALAHLVCIGNEIFWKGITPIHPTRISDMSPLMFKGRHRPF